MFSIGDLALREGVFLAPMAGLTDAPMRHLAWLTGAACTTSEMVTSKETLWRTPKSAQRRVRLENSGPYVVQIAGSEPTAMADIARRHMDDGAEAIDINFGCPAKKVCRRDAGSALLGQPDLVGRIVESVAQAVTVPVTIKMRTGVSPEARNGVQVAQIAEAAGAQAIAVHGRSRADRFNGVAEFETVARIKQAVSVPVIANGDLRERHQVQRVLRDTGVDAVMVGRAAIGAPWLLGELAGRAPLSLAEKWSLIQMHVELVHEQYGLVTGVRMMRKHMKAYLQNLGLSRHAKRFTALEGGNEQRRFVAQLAQQELQEQAA